MQSLKKEVTILYITFVDFEAPSESGSSVRTKRMYDAFQQLGCKVILVSGITNNRSVRQKSVAQALEYLKEHKPDLCYIEPPTGPLFFSCDRNLIRKLHRMQIPIGFFYRDIYWKFNGNDFLGKNVSIQTFVKQLVIKAMQYRDYYMLKKCVTQFYFTAASVNKYMGFSKFGVLPPGCVEKHIEKEKTSVTTGIYVGGATERYGMGLLLDSWMQVQKIQDKKLLIVCPEAQWEAWVQKYPKYQQLPENIHIYHLCDGQELEKLYAISDFAMIPILKTSYNDMALPIKLYEYLSYGLPMVATNCEEMKKVIIENEIGVIANDNVADFSRGIQEMLQNIKAGKNNIVKLEAARRRNLWTERVMQIINDLQDRW